MRWALFQAGIGVDLNEPSVEVLIEDEVVAEHFEGVLPAMGVYGLPHRIEALEYMRFHSWHYVLVDVFFAARLLGIQDFLQTLEWEDVAVLELAVCVQLFLDCVIGEVHCCVINVLKIDAVLGTWRPDVPFFKQVDVLVLVMQHPHSYVKLAVV